MYVLSNYKFSINNLFNIDRGTVLLHIFYCQANKKKSKHFGICDFYFKNTILNLLKLLSGTTVTKPGILKKPGIREILKRT